MNINSVRTGQLIASIRKQKNMTQQDVAEKLHITNRAVSKWERGLSFPSVDVLENLASVLDVTIMDLLAGEIIQTKDITEKSNEISVQVLKKEKHTRKALIAMCVVAMLMVMAAMLSIWGSAIFQRGNPIPYLFAATKISDEQPYIQVGNNAGIYISKRGECPELFEYVEHNWNLEFIEQAGGAFIFSNGMSNLAVSSEIYWGKYTVWIVPQVTLQG